MSRRVLVARLDGAGDVLLSGPCVRAIAGTGEHVTFLCSERSRDVARLLPGVADVLTFEAPWILADAPPVSQPEIDRLREEMARRAIDHAVLLTSFHQSALPLALILRLAGIPRISAVSEDFPGSLLDDRIVLDTGLHEAERAAAVAVAAGYPDSSPRLAVEPELPDVTDLTGTEPYVVVHPGSDAPSRALPPDVARRAVRALTRAGHRVVVTGGPDDRLLTADAAGAEAVDLGGRTSWAQLGAVLRAADALVAGNTGAAHLSAAVGTPVVSVFAPVVPARRWQPFGVPVVVLGDQAAACAGSRARQCPVPGHPCVAGITGESVVAAVAELAACEVPA